MLRSPPFAPIVPPTLSTKFKFPVYTLKMQLLHQKIGEPVWYFIFGPPIKSSFCAQYALEHGYQHLSHPTEAALRSLYEHRKPLIVEGTTDLFYAVEKWKNELTAVFVPGSELSPAEDAIRRDYEIIGRAEYVPQSNYVSFRKELNPQLVIVYGASEVLITSLLKSYFNHIGYFHISGHFSANELLSLPKGNNYMFTDFVPEIAEMEILHAYYHVKIVHLRHNRTELAGREAFFDKEAQLTPLLQGKHYYHSVSGYINDIIEQVGRSLLPQMLYVNVNEAGERQAVKKYAEERNALLLNVFEIQEVLRRKPNKAKAEYDKNLLLTEVIFLNFTRSQIIITDHPFAPQEFAQFQSHTRRFRQFADFVRADHYQFSKTYNSPIYFLQTRRRKQVDPELPFDSQVTPRAKYLLVSGAACVGKSSAAKFIASQMGYRHIEYEPYLASVKEKLIAPEDGEELPFRKVIAHFAGLVAASQGTPILIDGLALDVKDIEAWTKAVGPATVLNLKVDEKELIRRTRKKAEGDLNAEIGEQEMGKAKEALAKNGEWTDALTAKSPLSTIYQVDFSQQLILAEELLRDILRPRVFLVQENQTFLFQNLAIRHAFAFFDLSRFSLQEVATEIRKNSFRNVLLANYRQDNHELICKDFYWIEKNIGTIRYLAVFGHEDAESHDETLHLEKPAVAEKPKPAEGEEGGQPAPPAEEQGEKKKVFNIYDHSWTRPGNRKNLSQWFFKQKRNPAVHEHSQADLASKGLSFVLDHLASSREAHVYHRIGQ